MTYSLHSSTTRYETRISRNDVLDLVARKLLREVGKGRLRSFLPELDLDVRLSKSPKSASRKRR